MKNHWFSASIAYRQDKGGSRSFIKLVPTTLREMPMIMEELCVATQEFLLDPYTSSSSSFSLPM
jgi:hypothetical protein